MPRGAYGIFNILYEICVLCERRAVKMPSMKRWLFNILAGAPLIMCVATTELWVRSYWYWDKLDSAWPAHGAGIASCHGSIVVNVKWRDDVSELPVTGWSTQEPMMWSFVSGVE